MAKIKKEVDPDAYETERRHLAELRIKRIVNWTGYGFIGLVTVILIMVFSGERFDGFLGIFGLRGISNVESGIYTDCSKAENRNTRYCSPKETESAKTWKDISSGGKGSAKFSLQGY